MCAVSQRWLSFVQAAGENSLSFSLSPSHTHAHVPHAYGRHQPTVHPKAPWEICKLADARRCPSCSPGLISPTRRVGLRTRAFVSGLFMNIYDFLTQTRAHIPLRPSSVAGSELGRGALPRLQPLKSFLKSSHNRLDLTLDICSSKLINRDIK